MCVDIEVGSIESSKRKSGNLVWSLFRRQLSLCIDDVLDGFMAAVELHADIYRLPMDDDMLAEGRQTLRDHWLTDAFDPESPAGSDVMRRTNLPEQCCVSGYQACLPALVEIAANCFPNNDAMRQQCVDAVINAVAGDLAPILN